MDQTTQQAENIPAGTETDHDELLFGEEVHMLFAEEDDYDMEEIYQTEDTVYFVQKNKNAIVEARLSPDEKPVRSGKR